MGVWLVSAKSTEQHRMKHTGTQRHTCVYKMLTYSCSEVFSVFATRTCFESVFGLEDAAPSSPLIWQEIKRRQDINDTLPCAAVPVLAAAVIPLKHRCVCCLSCRAGWRKIHPTAPLHPSVLFFPRATKRRVHWTIRPKCLWLFQKCHFLMVAHSFPPPLPPLLLSSLIPGPPYLLLYPLCSL